MLGVLKRRWKPKRASSNRLSNQGKTEQVVQDPVLEKPRSAPSARQIHPLCDDKAQLLAYESDKVLPPTTDAPNSPPPPPLPTYPLTPNIIVEGGRIEFIKTPTDGSVESKCTPSLQRSMHNVTRAQQTDFESDDEKCDLAKERLEARIQELERALEAEQKNSQRERLALARLQRQLARREVLQRDVDRERRLRMDAEVRLRDSNSEAERCRSRLGALQRDFARMEDTVRSMLQYKSRNEQLKQDKTSLTVAYETRIHQFQNTITKLNQENETLKKQVRALEAVSASDVQNTLLERLQLLETENCNLTRDAELQRRDYERCLDEVANQVVRALLSQKSLREEINSLKKRIKELEAQNQALTSMLVQQLNHDGIVGEKLSADSLLENRALQALQASCDNPEERLSSGSPTANIILSGLYSPASCIPETPMTSGTSASTPSSGDLVTPDDDKQVLIKHRLRRQHLLGKLWEDWRQGKPDSTPLLECNSPTSSLITTLTNIEPVLWLPLQRPHSLNLQLHKNRDIGALAVTNKCCQHNHPRPFIAPLRKQSTGEEEGSESPESGNRDEGYSTMSSDIQCEAVRSGDSTTNGIVADPSRKGLEDLKEETDVTVVTTSSMTMLLPLDRSMIHTQSNKLVMVEDATDPDVLYFPIGLALKINTGNPRHSFPPAKDILPFQHVMRSFSDSHLCLKFTTSSSSCSVAHQEHTTYSVSSAASSSPSVLVVDVIGTVGEQIRGSSHPLRRTKGTTSLLPVSASNSKEGLTEEEEEEGDGGSWCGGVANSGDVVVEGCWWDADYIQHWLRLDDTRSTFQQQHRDFMELEYDRAEMEDWSMSLSCDDIISVSSANTEASHCNSKYSVADGTTPSQSTTPGQVTLPSIQENNTVELEEDSSECLWNNASYLVDNPCSEIVNLLVNGEISEHNRLNGLKNTWPYQNNVTTPGNYSLTSPGGSWSSAGTNSEECCHSYDCALNECSRGGMENSSKRSSAAMSGCSDDVSPAVGIDFTRDFYRLVKFESTKSLASSSSRSLVGNCDGGGSLNYRQFSEVCSALDHTQIQDREQALQSVLNFIAEQQQYCVFREEEDSAKENYFSSRPSSMSQDDSDVQERKKCFSHSSDSLLHDPYRHDGSNRDSLQSCQTKDLSAIDCSEDRQSTEEKQSNCDACLRCNNTGQNIVPSYESVSSDIIPKEKDKGQNEERNPIIELNDIGQLYTGMDENEVQSSSNRKVNYSETILNEHNSLHKHVSKNRKKNKSEITIDKCIDSTHSNLHKSNLQQISRSHDETNCHSEHPHSSRSKGQQKQQTCRNSKNDSDSVQKPCKKSETENQKHSCRTVEEISNVKCTSNVNVEELNSGKVQGLKVVVQNSCSNANSNSVPHTSCRNSDILVTVIEEEEEEARSSPMDSSSCREMSESYTSTVSTPDTVIGPANRRSLHQRSSPDSSTSSNSVIVGSPHAQSVSFHERATSKDVIDELNRMIRKGDETSQMQNNSDSSSAGLSRLDMACCCPTGWVHVERDIDFTDPKARANLLDVMLASSGSSNSSSSSESGDEPVDYQHLHRLHRFRRQKKASATREQLGVLRYPSTAPRPSIIGRDDFYVRYGDKEREAVASFDFLEDMSTTSVSGASSCDTVGSNRQMKKQDLQEKQNNSDVTTPSSDDTDERIGGQISLSDSCAASFSGSSGSLENQTL